MKFDDHLLPVLPNVVLVTTTLECNYLRYGDAVEWGLLEANMYQCASFLGQDKPT